ncbi:restriction endonuclease subunit S [Vibrio parahaemolyticus]|uniref:restriction endonuclease subunit S n=1 Tax=Vibrio parahaemolyticus TaxID=670 RepID=UPI001A2DAFE1|nr:type I restriction endonuclease subunit S [Vibrio parahaemolyticus]EID0723195.1 restriction endonuclease subunit S [Vibrio parahaemolyticus]EJG1583987.1 restriction endonuclease subunit S [Vibrio parahaemolyticus]HCH3518300.1 restriction endonuclease subunit S [Vibrio parahaemolyticus]HCH6533219.1 restriction endonuclease subunit S [Vibrio parahaemolyticus]
MSEVNFPSDWVACSISDVAQVNPKKIDAEPDTISGFVPMALAPISFSDSLRYEEKYWKEIKKSYTNFQNGDVLFAKVTPCFENGKAAIVDGLPNGIGAGSSEFYVLRPHTPYVLPEILFALIKTQKFANDGAANMTGAVGLRRVPRAFVESFDAPMIPIAEQKVIAEKLGTLLAQVEETKARLETTLETLKQFRQSVLAAAVSGKLTEDWRHSQNANAWAVKNLGDVIGKISQGWSPKCLNHATVENRWGVIKTSSIQEMSFLQDENKELPESLEAREHLKVEVGDILTTRAGPRSRCGVTCFVEEVTRNLMICDKVYRYQVKPESGYSKFLAFQLNSPAILDDIEALKTGISESGMNLTQKKFKQLSLRWPSIDEQKEILCRVEKLFWGAETAEQQVNRALEQVNNLTQSILAKAFRGELTEQWRKENPKLISGDNSAEALLTKIRAEREAVKPKRKTAK